MLKQSLEEGDLAATFKDREQADSKLLAALRKQDAPFASLDIEEVARFGDLGLYVWMPIPHPGALPAMSTLKDTLKTQYTTCPSPAPKLT